MTEKLRYRLLSGPDDAAFCERVSEALADGYVLHGGPAATFDGTRVIVAQAVALPRTTHETRPRMSYAGDLTPQQAWDLLTSDASALLVDVRTDAEWAYVGIPDASSIDGRSALVEWVSYPSGRPNPQFLKQLSEVGLAPGDGRPIVFLCRSGVRSIAAANAATAAGLGPAYNVLEGFEGDVGADGHRGHSGWRAAGLPWRQR